MATRTGDFPTWLREQRAERGWSQEDAAQAVGAKFTTYRKWETGSTEPGMTAFLRIVDVYGWPSAMGRYLAYPSVAVA